MNLKKAQEGFEYIIRNIVSEDEELNSFLFTLGCYVGEPITVISRRKTELWTFGMLISGIVIAVVLSMGTDLHWNAEAVELTLPGMLAEKLGRQTMPILLPSATLRR